MYKEKALAYLGLFLKSIIVGLSFIFIKIALKYTNPLDLLAHRFTMAFLSLLILIVFKVIKMPKFSFKRYKSLFFISIFYPLSYFFIQSYGMKYSSASQAGFIFATLPIMTLVAAEMFLKEKNSLLQRVGIVLSVLGLFYILINRGGFSKNFFLIKGSILILLSVFAMVSYYILGKKFKIEFSALEITSFITIIAFIFFNTLSITSHLINGTIKNYLGVFLEIEFIWSVLYLGILSSVLTAFLINFSLERIPASHMSIFSNFAPIITILAGVIFLKEQIHLYQIIGAILVVVGIIFTIIFKRKDN